MRSMSFNPFSTGIAGSATAQVPIERRLAELADRHRVVLSQARVLSEVVRIAQASAVLAIIIVPFHSYSVCISASLQ